MGHWLPHGHSGQNLSVNPGFLRQCPGKLQGRFTACSRPVGWGKMQLGKTQLAAVVFFVWQQASPRVCSPGCGKSECFQFYWLVFKSNQILLLKWDNEAALATAPWLHDHMWGAGQGCLLSAAVHHRVPVPLVGQLGDHFPWRRRRPFFSYGTVQRSFFLTALDQLPRAAFYVLLYLFASEDVRTSVCAGVVGCKKQHSCNCPLRTETTRGDALKLQ